MRRWHSDSLRMHKWRALYISIYGKDWPKHMELGRYRKVKPLRCPDSRLCGRGGCKAHKTMGNGRGAKKFSQLRREEMWGGDD